VFRRPARRAGGGYKTMSAIQATRLKKGMLILLEGDLFRILELQHVTPGNLRGFVRVKLRNLRSGTLSDQRLRSEDTVQRATLDEIEMQYMYSDSAGHHFMDTSTYEQISLADEVLGEMVGYLVPESLIKVEFYGTEPVGIELPQTVDLAVKDTSPAIKGATASAQLKPATLETGLVVQVPPFINVGDRVRINTESGDYQSRA
jgi:elongation factor P